jgi:hypothetical protein
VFSGHAVQLAAIDPSGKRALECDAFVLDDSGIAAAVKWAADRNAKGLNLYWQPNAVRSGINRRPKKEDIAAVRVLQADIDPVDGERPEVAKERLIALAQRLHGTEAQPMAAASNYCGG